MSPSFPRRLDVAEICQEASERAGIEFRSGYALTTARRSLELLQMEWANRGLNLWTIDKIETPIYVNVASYAMPADTVDVLDAAIRNWPGTGSPSAWKDTQLERIPLGSWAGYPDKLQPGKPTAMLVCRVDPMEVRLHPVPNRTGGTLVLWRLRYMKQPTPGGAGAMDMPVRFVPAMIAGLAYQLALKSKGAAFQRAPGLKQIYEEEFALAAEEDRDRSSARFVPLIHPY